MMKISSESVAKDTIRPEFCKATLKISLSNRFCFCNFAAQELVNYLFSYAQNNSEFDIHSFI
jgi:hypothetical protein